MLLIQFLLIKIFLKYLLTTYQANAILGVKFYTCVVVMVEGLTNRQREILDMIVEHMQREGRPPSIPEIASHFGMKSPNGVAKHLAALEAKGAIEKGHGARAIKLADWVMPPTAPDVAYAPVLGKIAAGEPILAAEYAEDTVPLPKSILSGAETPFLLEVKGESMIEEGILPGDYVIIAKDFGVRNGDIAAVRIDDEATVKIIYREGNTVRLQPANSAYEPIILHNDGRPVEIIGKVIGLIRSYSGHKIA
jgi:repressor LexA